MANDEPKTEAWGVVATRMQADLLERITAAAQENGVDRSEFIRQACEHWISRKASLKKQAFRRNRAKKAAGAMEKLIDSSHQSTVNHIPEILDASTLVEGDPDFGDSLT